MMTLTPRPSDVHTVRALRPVDGDPLGRCLIELDEVDYGTWNQVRSDVRDSAIVKDRLTDRLVLLERADCGGGCRCAALATVVRT